MINRNTVRKIRSVGVFCGSSIGRDAIYSKEAARLGMYLAENNITMVYGGGNIGLMGVIADTMLNAGGKVIGVIPAQLVHKELAHSGVKDMRIVKGMSARKELIYDLSDAFVALPGGYGTLDEIFEMLTQFQLGLSGKPCGLLNVNNYFDHLVKQLDLFVAERFLHQTHRAHLLVGTEPAALLAMMDHSLLQSPEGEGWINELKNNNMY